MSKAHKIFYQSTDRKSPWALELCVYYDYPKVYDIDGCVYHSDLERNVRSFYFTVYSSFLEAFKKVWCEIMEPLASRYGSFDVSKADYQLVFMEFQKLLESSIDDRI